MCDCHPMTKEERAVWHRVRKEPNTIEDWRDLHNAIEDYKRRYMARHAPPATGEAQSAGSTQKDRTGQLQKSE